MKSILVSIVAAVLVVGCGGSKVSKDSKTSLCVSQLQQIDNAKEMWSTVEKKADGETLTEDQLGKYFKDGMPSCPSRGDYIIGAVGARASCSIHVTANNN